MTKSKDLLRVLKETSRTFFIPIIQLPGTLQETVGAAYLCMRAIDEIEDHPTLDNASKAFLLHRLSWALQAQVGSGNLDDNPLEHVFSSYQRILPEVTLRLTDWLNKIPVGIAPRVWDATIAMADRMAYWVERNWEILNEADLDSYTFSVAGSVGLLICDIWVWFHGSQIDRKVAIQFGRGLQGVNILRNRSSDLSRGVDFYPQGWSDSHMFLYADRYLTEVKKYLSIAPAQSFRMLVDIPLALAEATLQALKEGKSKLTRRQVMKLVGEF